MAWERFEKAEKPKIAICVPHRGNLPAEWVERTYGPLRFIPVDWCIKIRLMCKSASLPLARTILAENALKHGVDYLFWLDTDNIFETPSDPNLALKMLYDCGVPIVSGLYRTKKSTGFQYAMWHEHGDGYLPIEKWTGNWLKVDVVGMGCCLVKAEVFRNLEKPWFHWEESGTISEDFYFFEKTKRAGYDVRVFTEIRLSHLGDLKVMPNGTIRTLEI